MKYLVWIIAAGILSSCAGSSMKNSFQSAPLLAMEPSASVVDVTVDASAPIKRNFTSRHSVIWTLTDLNAGYMLAGGIEPAKKLPLRVVVKSQDVKHPLTSKSNLVMSVRVVKKGEEFLPPKKGQAVGFLGGASEDAHIVTPGVQPEVLRRAATKLSQYELKPLTIGSVSRLEIKTQIR